MRRMQKITDRTRRMDQLAVNVERRTGPRRRAG